MPEIIIRQIAFGADGGPANLANGIKLPIDNETLDKTMMCMKVKYPYIAHSYSFRLDGLNGQITGPQPLDKLNSLATLLNGMSEYERVKLEGAVILTDCKSPEDCAKLLYNLDSFDLTPNVGNYEALGRYFAENDCADSLKGVPQDMMEHFDYDLLGRMGWDDHTNVFVNGHHIRDMEHDIHEYDLTREPNPAYLKMRLVSDNNPDGVWIKFPLSGMEAVDTPEQSDELAVTLAGLKANSLDECRAAECRSVYPTLTKCLDAHAGEPLEQILWKAHNLGFAESELGQFGSDQNCAKFAAALEYEGCSNLDFAADITQNLGCYDFAPTLEGWAENHLLRQGVDPALASCFDLKKLGDTLAADNGVVVTETGVISRNGHEFNFEYCHFPQESHTQEKEIRLFCPLEVTTDPDSTLGEEYGEIVSEFENATIPNSVAADYKDEILAAIDKELHPEERERGLAKYLDDNLAAKVSYIWPSVEVWNDKLYGVIDIRLKQDLSPAELAELTDYCIGQMSDGMGEGFEQRPVKTQDGDLYVSLWQSGGDYFMKPEQEFKQMFPEQEQTMQMGM